MLKKLLLFILFSVVFVYGVGVGTYKIFPYNEIRALKGIISAKVESKTYETSKFLHKTSFFNLISQSDYDIVFVGDSLTERSL